jgi:hypothetical protein
MQEWVKASAVEVPQALRFAVGGHPLVAETLVRRGIIDVEGTKAFLDPDHYQPALRPICRI